VVDCCRITVAFHRWFGPSGRGCDDRRGGETECGRFFGSTGDYAVTLYGSMLSRISAFTPLPPLEYSRIGANVELGAGVDNGNSLGEHAMEGRPPRRVHLLAER